MPELPETETIARDLHRELVGAWGDVRETEPTIRCGPHHALIACIGVERHQCELQGPPGGVVDDPRENPR